MDWPNITINKDDDFHAWRKNSLGSSDAPVLMGVSPYKTPYTLWMEKTGIKSAETIPNYAMQYGIDNEQQIREYYNNKTNSNMVPERKIHPDFDYLRCNADGVDHVKKRMIEIKTAGLEVHDSGVVPEKYIHQCIFLSTIFGYPIDYVSYCKKSSDPYKIIEVSIAPIQVDLLMNAAHTFWNLVQTKVAPPFVDNDIIEIESNEVKEMINRYNDLKIALDITKEEIGTIQKTLSEMIGHKKSSCNGYKMTWVERKGSINYKKIPDMENVDLEQFRGKPTRFFTLKKETKGREGE